MSSSETLSFANSVSRNNIVVFSGGSAANNLVDVFSKVAEEKNCHLSYIIPISDNGGSSSELIRVFGGPGIGDVRSRLVRLIPESEDGNAEKTHPTEKRELIRSFLNSINLEIVKRARPSSVFNFQSASVGNLFLTAARLYTGSFESGIYLLGAITDVPANVAVIPAINSNFSHHICAGLKDGSRIIGQNAISHPISCTTIKTAPESNESTAAHRRTFSEELLNQDRVEDANLPGSLPSLRRQYIEFRKDHAEDLPSRIERIWYINPYGQEIRPTPNSKVINAIDNAQYIIYSIGSLYTSVIPCLILKNVGDSIANPRVTCKILILNGSIDRETGPSSSPFSARDFIAAIADACQSSKDENGRIDRIEYSRYVTHLVHLEGEGTPAVKKHELKEMGIESVRVYGRKAPGGGMLYDGNALIQALGAILGRRTGRFDQSRRNTLQH